jgi:hypothetical protein
VHGTGSESYLAADFGTSGDDLSGFATRELIRMK